MYGTVLEGEYLLLAVAPLMGLAVGSFLNVVVLRGRRREKLTGRSLCEGCRTQLSWQELLPLFSFLLQKGRCRHCGTALSWQYPLVEAGTAAAYLAVAGAAVILLPPGIWPFALTVLGWIGMAAAIVIAVSDIRFHIIPNGAFLTLLVLGLLLTLLRIAAAWGIPIPLYLATASVWYDIVSACALTGVLASLWFFSRGQWIGLGDAKLMLAASLITGFPVSLIAFLFSFWLGGAAGIILLASGAKSFKSRIPFGPFILGGFLLAQVFAAPFLSLSGLGETGEAALRLFKR